MGFNVDVGKYVGNTVEIVYIDRYNRITQRVIEVRSVKGNRIHAYCLLQRAPRVFDVERILAVAPARRTG